MGGVKGVAIRKKEDSIIQVRIPCFRIGNESSQNSRMVLNGFRTGKISIDWWGKWRG